MDKIDRRIYKDNYSEANRELINKCIEKIDEFVGWANKYEETLEHNKKGYNGIKAVATALEKVFKNSKEE